VLHEKVDDGVVRPLDIAAYFGVSEVPSTVLHHEAEDPLPALVVRRVHHAAEDAPVRLRAEDRGAQNAVQQSVGSRVIEQDQVARLARAGWSKMRLEAAFPVAVPQGRRARRDGELSRHEIVVGNGVGGEVGEIAKSERAHRFI